MKLIYIISKNECFVANKLKNYFTDIKENFKLFLEISRKFKEWFSLKHVQKYTKFLYNLP